MKRIVVLLLILFAASSLMADKTLFPERERFQKRAKAFFRKNLNRKLHFIKRMENKLQSGNYYSPFIMLTENAAKDKVLIKSLRTFADNHYGLLDRFRDVRATLNTGNYKRFVKEWKLTPLRFHLLLLHTLLVGYEDNELTGTIALNFWELIVRNTEAVWCREGKKRPHMLGVTGLSSRFIFFKRHRKWSRRFSKYVKKLKTSDPDLQYVSLKY